MAEITPGEGERRAQSGYVPQYDTAAMLIYEGIASGDLQWIGVADRSAGTFDDIVLGYRDKAIAYQMKSTGEPASFSLRTLLLGAENVLGKIHESRRKLTDSLPPGTEIQTIFITDKLPREDDALVNHDRRISSAAYLRAHAAFARSLSLKEWLLSDKADFIRELWTFSGLGEGVFEALWRHTGFHTGDARKKLGIEFPTDAERKRIKQIADELPRLVAHRPPQDRWFIEELLARLGWDPAFSLKHTHSFPVDVLYESNEETHRALGDALRSKSSGYIGLVGPPGCGKSTLLAAGVLPSPRARVIRYLAFVPGRGQGFGRGEAVDFLGDLIRQFKREGLGRQIVPGSELGELRTQFGLMLHEAAEQFGAGGLKTVIVVDGLDHVPREERPMRSLLCELPLPQSVPEGVVIVLGTQKLDLADVSDSVQSQASKPDRLIPVTPLTPAKVARLAELAQLPADIPVNAVFDKAKGHPLATRYVIETLSHLSDAEQRRRWLLEGPEYGGDINVFYDRTWNELRRSRETVLGLQYLALIEAPISPLSLDGLIGSEATDSVSASAGHLLRIDSNQRWSIFHNSYRLFLRSKFETRYGIPNESLLLQRYRELAALASQSLSYDEQRWLELRYRLRAVDSEQALQLATPEYFREQLLDGRAADEIHSDLRLLMTAIKKKRDFAALVAAIFSTHELNMRIEVINDEIVDAYIALGIFNHARNLIRNGSYAVSSGKGYDLVERLLYAGELVQAKELFAELEPLEYLYGQAEWDGLSNHGRNDLERWAELSLAFRSPVEVTQAMDRIQVRDHGSRAEEPKPDTQSLRLFAAKGQLQRHPDLNAEDVRCSLSVKLEHRSLVEYFGIAPAIASGLFTVARQRCEWCLAQRHNFGTRQLLRLASALLQLSMTDEARTLLNDLSAPTFDADRSSDDEHVGGSVEAILLFASFRAQLGLEPLPGRAPKTELLKLYQGHLEKVGTIHGALKVRGVEEANPLRRLLHFLDFLERAESSERPNFHRGSVSRSMFRALPILIQAAGLHSADTLRDLSADLDARLQRGAKHLSISSFRRAFAIERYKSERSTENAKRRIDFVPSAGYQTPFEELSELGETIVAYTAVNLADEAKALLKHLETDGLGISRRAKKDPQYLLWESLFRLANEADPAGREGRVRFLTRFLSGLSESEGSGAASRIVGTLIEEAAKCSYGICEAVLNSIENSDISTWSEIVSSICVGIASSNPAFTGLCADLYGRLSIPFSDGIQHSDLDVLIEVAPEADLKKVASDLIECISTDARTGSRIQALETVIDAARRRGLVIGEASLVRWREELPPPKSGSSPEDPFFLARSIEDISRTFELQGELVTTYGARTAFIRVLEWADFDEAMRLFHRERTLNQDEGVLEEVARRSAKCGSVSERDAALEKLKQIAAEEGSWGGGWQSAAKLRYHRLVKELGAAARQEDVFSTFVADCSAGKESIENLLPDLTQVFQLFGDMVDWARVWEALEAHLRLFREYRMGQELNAPDGRWSEPVKVLAGLLLRGLTTTVDAISDCVRAASIIGAVQTGGDLVVGEFVSQGIASQGDLALEAAQVCWECREVSALRPLLEEQLPVLMQSVDAGVLGIGLRLAAALNVSISFPHGSLPWIYEIELPDGERYSKYDMPSGFSLSSAGIFTNDYAAWTWILKRQIRLVAKASGLPEPNVRFRVGQLMQALGGEELFGPEAVSKQISRLRRLSLHLTYRKLISGAALQAVRSAAGELMKAEAIDLSALPFFEVFSGGRPPILPSTFPTARPSSIPSHPVFEMFSRETPNWTQNAEADLVVPRVENWLVLAGVSTFRSGFREEGWTSERYYGPEIQPADDLFGQLQGLPHILLTDRVSATFSSPSPGGVAYLMHTLPGFEVCPISFCPVTAAALGWVRDKRNALLYRDQEGVVAARTIYWRDGGIPASEVDRNAHGHGFIVAVRPKYLTMISPYLAERYIARAWRRKHKGEDEVDAGFAEMQTTFEASKVDTCIPE